MQFFALVSDCSIIYNLGRRSFVYASVAKFLGCLGSEIQTEQGISEGSWVPEVPGGPGVPGLGHTFLPCLYLQGLFKTISKFHEKNKSQESDLSFGQWKTLSENYKAIKVFVYKIAKNNCRLRHFTDFFQT